MYVDAQLLSWSLSKLNHVHPFFGISFLAFKRLAIPCGTVADVPIAQEEQRLLDTYYSPAPEFTGYYIPFRGGRGRQKRWVTHRYADTTLQRIRKDTFAAPLLHEPDSALWGWQPNYVELLRAASQFPAGGVPALALAAWMYRSIDFDEFVPEILVSRLVEDFDIADAELPLFDLQTDNSNFTGSVTPLDWRTLRAIIGAPPGSPPEYGATLGHLFLRGVGPSTEIELTPAPRLNLLTGDNGYGKSFLLECAWWALTGDWIEGRPARPISKSVSEATIAYSVGRTGVGETVSNAYDWTRQTWRTVESRSILPGLALFARADGSFAVWDPARTAGKLGGGEYLFLSREETWNGKQAPSPEGGIKSQSEGLLRDWVTWQSSDSPQFHVLQRVLERLSPPEFDPPLAAGDRPLLPDDARPIPTLRHPYGDVPITYTSAGISRIVSLAYLLVWAWTNHVQLSNFARRPPQDRLILFIDEVEAHLHPKWQRSIVPALLAAIGILQDDVQIQVFIATHAPLVLASLEPEFDEDTDRVFHLDLCPDQPRNVCLTEVPFIKRGPVDNWLQSEVFGLKQARSLPAERAIERAKQLQARTHVDTEDVSAAHRDLEESLGPHDEFWPRWRHFALRFGVDS